MMIWGILLHVQWNGHGYDVAKIFAKKFDIISPVWFQITKQDDNYKVLGTHDIDARWMKSVRDKGKSGSRTAAGKYIHVQCIPIHSTGSNPFVNTHLYRYSISTFSI